ncbi:MAG TPA: dienelactone hydrolase [Gammaproteobacteria bacterium]|nr:dienelactone hydrolase [Gammaproteobacteria bacterium]
MKQVPGFEEFRFAYGGFTHRVLRKGDGQQPGVLIIQELPGITRETIELAERLHRDGFTVYLPVLFGQPDSPFEPLKNLAKVCVSFEFRVLANRRRGPVADWLRALCRRMQAECGDIPVGAIGMCFTGGFALTLMVDDAVAAPVSCQPGNMDGMVGKQARRSLGVTATDMAAARKRSHEQGVPVMGMRFSNDVMCPRARFDYLQDQFGDNFRRIEIDSSLFNKHRIPPWAHSVLTLDFVDKPDHPTRQAYDQMVGFFRERLHKNGATQDGCTEMGHTD